MILLVTGLLRKKQEFRDTLQSYNELRESGVISDVYFSSWEERVTKDDLAFLSDYNVKVVLDNEPNNIGPGSVYAQVKALSNGLKEIDDNAFVFKSRTDVIVKPELVKAIFEKKEDGGLAIEKNSFFNSKIWLNAFEITKPFYVEDTAYAGLCSDLKSIVNEDSSFDAGYGKCTVGGLTHIRQFIKPFICKFEILESYKKLLLQGGEFINVEQDKLRQQLSNDEDYREMLATYYHILLNYFHVYHIPGSLQHKQNYCSSLSSPFDASSFLRNFVTQRSGTTIRRWCHNEEWLRNIEQGLYNNEAPASDICYRMKNVRAQD